MLEPIAGREVDLARYARLAGGWAVVFLVLVLLVVPWLGLEETLGHLSELGLGLALVVLGLSLANYGLRALRWQLLSRAVGVVLPLARNGLYYIAGFAFTITPGKLGEVVRLWLLRRHHGYAYERTLGLLVIDRLTDAMALLLLSFLGVARFAGQGWTVAAITLAMVAALLVVLRPGWLAAAIKFAYGRIRRAPRLFARLLRALNALRLLVTPAVLGTALLLGLLGWSAEIFGTWLVLEALGAEVGLLEAGFVFAFGMLIGGLPLFPGGLGGTEATMIALLLLLGVDATTAVAATAIVRLATLGFAVGLGFLFLPPAIAAPRTPAAHLAARP